MPTAVIIVTAETGFIFIPATPKKPANSTVISNKIPTIMAKTKLVNCTHLENEYNHSKTIHLQILIPAAHGLSKINEMTQNTERAITPIARIRLELRCMYCSQNVNATPEGKLGRPSAANLSQTARISCKDTKLRWSE